MKNGFDERFMPDNSDFDFIHNEHAVRYALAGDQAKNKIVLDIACGEGYGSFALAKAGAKKVIGVDIDASAIAAARAKYQLDNLEFINSSAENLSEVADNSIDLIVSFETIEHVPDYESYLKSLQRVLKDDGQALISTPNLEVFGNQNPFHVKEFTYAEFEAVLQKYFSSVKIYEQVNGLASVIKGAGESGDIVVTGSIKPHYFIAACSKDKARLAIDKKYVSVNPVAYERRENNPAWKLINKVYKIVRKFV